MAQANSMIPIAHVYVKDKGYSVVISMDVTTRHLHVFKYSEETYTCEYEVFDTEYECQCYLEKPLPSFKF